PDGRGEGRVAGPGGAAARAAQLPDPADHGGDVPDPADAGGRGGDRAGVRLARHGAARGQLDRPARLPGHRRVRALRGGSGADLQPGRGPPVRRRRPESEPAMSATPAGAADRVSNEKVSIEKSAETPSPKPDGPGGGGASPRARAVRRFRRNRLAVAGAVVLGVVVVLSLLAP